MIKKLNAALLTALLTISLVFPAVSTAEENPYYYHDCTWTAWQIAHDYLGITLPAWGGASGWITGAERDGYQTGDVPAANAIMVWRGHVGFITQVSADGQSVYIQEGGWDDGDNWYHEGWYAAGGPSTSGKAFIGYVYLGSVPGSNAEPSSADVSPAAEDQTSSDTADTGSEAAEQAVSAAVTANETVLEKLPESSELTQVVSPETNGEKELALAALRAKKEGLGAEINETEETIAVLEKALDQAGKENEERLRAMYMFGNESYLAVLFSSESIADFFAKVEQISRVIASDRETVNQLEALAEELKAQKINLEQALSELNEIQI